MKALIGGLTFLLFSLASSLVIVAFSLNATLLSPHFLKASLIESEMYPAITRLVTAKIAEQELVGDAAGAEQIITLGDRLDASIFRSIAEQVIDDTYDWLNGGTNTVPTIKLAPLNEAFGITSPHDFPPVAFILPKYTERIRLGFFLYSLIIPLGIFLSVCCLILRFVTEETRKKQLKAEAAMFLLTAVPGLLVFIAPFTVSQLGTSRELTALSTPALVQEPLIRFLTLVVNRLTLYQGIPFLIMTLIGVILLIAAAKTDPSPPLPGPVVSQNTPDLKNSQYVGLQEPQG